jgi:DNA-binding transcriptional LysR family regulator
MAFARSDLADLAAFVAIARHRNFRQAGVELGVSASALSHALKGLEERLGVKLLNRTNRSVTLTAAGEDLLRTLGDPLAAVLAAEDVLNRHRDSPRGRVRVNVPDMVAEHLWPRSCPNSSGVGRKSSWTSMSTTACSTCSTKVSMPGFALAAPCPTT